MKKRGWNPQKPVVIQLASPDPLTWWTGPKNIAWVKIDGESSWALLNSGSTISVVTPGFIEAHSMDICPLIDLADDTPGYQWFQRSILPALGSHHHKSSGSWSFGL